MNIIVCLDDNLGMLFNRRRQSKDRRILEDIEDFAKEIMISSFSENLFAESSCEAEVNDHFLEKASKNTYCFVEAEKVSPYVLTYMLIMCSRA